MHRKKSGRHSIPIIINLSLTKESSQIGWFLPTFERQSGRSKCSQNGDKVTHECHWNCFFHTCR